jgi:hypothetical protein
MPRAKTVATLGSTLPPRMAGKVSRNRNNLRRLIAHVLDARDWRSAGQGQWVREHGEFYQRLWLQPSQWSTSANFLSCLPWLDGMDSLRALDTYVRRRDPHLLVVGALQEALEKLRRRQRAPTKRARAASSR